MTEDTLEARAREICTEHMPGKCSTCDDIIAFARRERVRFAAQEMQEAKFRIESLESILDALSKTTVYEWSGCNEHRTTYKKWRDCPKCVVARRIDAYYLARAQAKKEAARAAALEKGDADARG